MVRIFHATKSPQMVRNVYGTKRLAFVSCLCCELLIWTNGSICLSDTLIFRPPEVLAIKHPVRYTWKP